MLASLASLFGICIISNFSFEIFIFQHLTWMVIDLYRCIGNWGYGFLLGSCRRPGEEVCEEKDNEVAEEEEGTKKEEAEEE